MRFFWFCFFLVSGFLCFSTPTYISAMDIETDGAVFSMSGLGTPAGILAQTGTEQGFRAAVDTTGSISDPASLIGLTLDELLNQFGNPQSVYAVRGLEIWQDDVVFVYNEADFYIYKDRVWQLGLKSAYGIRLGDPRAAAFLVMEKTLEQAGERYLQCSLQNRTWATKLRVNLDSSGLVAAIFVFRSDF
jgi:hypothetical protein